ncbi:phospholipase DDHD1b isoform X3 [Epinephelus moara]|uniref:phospholipase DDHD1b isoform X3 n=1 Tax=Epinephelus moara TaxID=300413 RepID=UPI00214E748C|nr:phospholipase DDHD1b isoform X3 [Epinephelus moara]
MSIMKEKPAIRQQSSENNSVSSSEWDMANDVFVSGYDDNPMGDGVAAADRSPEQPGLDRHLPLLSQDGMMLGLAGEEYSGTSYLDIDPEYTESDGNVTTKRRIRSNSSRHRGEIVTELGPEEVRWFYKEDKRTWKPFVGHDSLKIETVYRRFCEQNPDKVKRLVDPSEAEGKEAASSGEIQPESGAVDGGSVRVESVVQQGGGQQHSVSEDMRDLDDISVEAVCVRGGLYEVDIREKECYPVYWNQQDRIPVMRGQWFIDGTWLPLEEDESDLIEMEHLARFRGQQMRDTYEMEVVTTTVDSKDDTVDSITPDKVRGLRDMLNSSAMDIMYYTSPLYRDEITKGLTLELNRLYSLFCSRNPDFEKNGKVSIVSHSLGCVITFDIMTGWDPVRFHHQEAPDPEETKVRWASDEEHHLQEQLRLTRLRLRDLEDQFHGLQTSSCAVPALKFKVENFFCMGSPLAVFLALRGTRPGNNNVQDHILPTTICKRLFNIFHPTDPVAYRLEPLILKHYSNIVPVQIHWYNTSNPTPYDHIRPTLLNPPKETASVSDSESIPSPCTSPPQARRHYGESITSLGKASIMGAASLGKGIGGILFSRFSRSSGQVGGVEEEPLDSEGGASEVENVSSGEEGAPVAETEVKDKEIEEDRTEVEPAMSQSTSSVMDSTSLELERRIDFELREGLVESRYWSAVTSHTAYWCSYDVALFLLTFMYRPQESLEPAEDNPETS